MKRTCTISLYFSIYYSRYLGCWDSLSEAVFPFGEKKVACGAKQGDIRTDWAAWCHVNLCAGGFNQWTDYLWPWGFWNSCRQIAWKVDHMFSTELANIIFCHKESSGQSVTWWHPGQCIPSSRESRGQFTKKLHWRQEEDIVSSRILARVSVCAIETGEMHMQRYLCLPTCTVSPPKNYMSSLLIVAHQFLKQ